MKISLTVTSRKSSEKKHNNKPLQDQQKKCFLTFLKMECVVLYFHSVSLSLSLSLRWRFFFKISDQDAEYNPRDQWLAFFSQTV